MMARDHIDKHGGGPSLPVRVAEVAVGTLQAEQGRGSHREHLFHYLSGSEERLAVSLNMPVRAQPYTYHGIHPIFEMNLPEGHLPPECSTPGIEVCSAAYWMRSGAG